MEINKANSIKGVAFKGYQTKKTDTGSKAYQVNCMYDSSKYDCEFQCFKVGKKDDGSFFVEKGENGSMEPFYSTYVPPEGKMVEPEYDMELGDKEPFAYRFVLREKDDKNHQGKIVKYLREDEAAGGGDGVTFVNRTGPAPIIHGPMYQAMVDTFNPGYVFAGFDSDKTGQIIKEDKDKVTDDVRNTVRTFGNTSGGTMAGLVVKLPELHQNGIRRLSLTPLRGGDKSSHKYWINNDFIMSDGIGNVNDYNTLVRETFKNGMNMVDDMAITSEGLQGIHFQRAIKWMDSDKKPPEYYYFRMSGLQDGALGLGVVPKNCENVDHKIVNAPFDYKEEVDKNGHIHYKEVENKKYDPSQPTYLQLFDKTMVSDKQINDKEHVIKHYEKNPDNKLGVNTHDDTIFPYTFEINPYEFKKNVESINELNASGNENIKLHSAEGTVAIGKLSGISIEGKDEGGFVCWDANTDMPKRNYFTSNYDMELLSDIKDPVQRKQEYQRYRQGNYEMQDIAISAARHLVRHVRNVQNEYVAKKLGDISSNPAKATGRINDILDTQNPKRPVLPDDLRLPETVVRNVLEDNYELRPKSSDYDKVLTSGLMDFPLDSIEFAPDTQGALSSPYLSKRSYNADHLKESRYDAMNDETYNVPKEYAKTYNKMNEIFTEDVKDFADDVLQKVEKNSKESLFNEDKTELSEYGQYVVPLVAEDIAKYAITKSLMPDVGTKILKNGEIAYDYDKMGKGSLRELGINGDSQEDEANQITNKIHSGMKDLNSGDVDFVAKSINKRIENTNANSFKLAEAMTDRAGYGIDLRFDAAKDVADMDAYRNGSQSFDKTWSNCQKFWGNIMDVVTEENPNTASFAEFTDLPDANSNVDKFLNNTGVASEANYSYFFDNFTNMFGYDFTRQHGSKYDSDGARAGQVEKVLNDFASRPTEYKRNSYVFASNHDKPRIIHCLSLNMELFNSDLSDAKNYDFRKTAYKLINDKSFDKDLGDNDYDIIKGSKDPSYFDNVSSKAIANGVLLHDSIGKVNGQFKDKALEGKSGDERDAINKEYDKSYAAFSKAIADVVNGKYYRNHPNVKDEKTKFVPYQPKDVPDDLKTATEKDGFGARAIPDAFDIVLDQAITKYELGEPFVSRVKNPETGDSEVKEVHKDFINSFRNDVDNVATAGGRQKAKIITRYLGALTGNPTIYAGDELGMTGYEEKCKNVYLQNRAPLDWSVVDKDSKNARPEIIKYRDEIMGIMANRKADDMNKMEALNDGTMYKLNPIGTTNGRQCSGIISQASNGAMSISLFNPAGINQSSDTPVDNLHPTYVEMGRIPLEGKDGNITLTPDKTVFRNVLDDDDSVYKVERDDNKGEYYLQKYDKYGNKQNVGMNEQCAPDGVMMLYYIPEDIQKVRTNIHNEKVKARQLYNSQHNFPSDAAYRDTTKAEAENGKNMDITSES